MARSAPRPRSRIPISRLAGRQWPRLTQKCCAPARLLIEISDPYLAVWYGWLLLQPWPPLWHSRFPYISLTPPAGRAGSRSRRAAAPYLAVTVASIPLPGNFRRCQWRRPPIAVCCPAWRRRPRSWPPAVGGRLDRRRICCTCRQRSKRTSGRRIVRPAQRHEGQLLLALHRHARLPQRAGRGVGQPPRPQPQTVREHAGRRSSGTPDSDDADAGRPAALGARAGDAAMGAHRGRRPGPASSAATGGCCAPSGRRSTTADSSPRMLYCGRWWCSRQASG